VDVEDLAAGDAQRPGALEQRTLLLSVDFEDWHQLVRRRVGDPSWRAPGSALARQTETMLSLFDALRVRCTFFILGMAARAHPELVRTIAECGHEIGCHGDQHVPVHSQTPEEFGADLRAGCATIEELTGIRPAGYRAPAFSITRREADWGYRILAAEGFAYDASQSDSFVIRDRLAPRAGQPHMLPEAGIWEFPVAVWESGAIRIPVGGASYWSLTPTQVVLRGLADVGAGGGLYMHPHEFDPRPLVPGLGPGATPAQWAHSWLRAAQRNLTRLRATNVLSAIADNFQLITYGEAHARLSAGFAARP
jgi:peptidoglycan/xylan/chitin deacetylase (PgdA/CDA1 family)